LGCVESGEGTAGRGIHLIDLRAWEINIQKAGKPIHFTRVKKRGRWGKFFILFAERPHEE